MTDNSNGNGVAHAAPNLTVFRSKYKQLTRAEADRLFDQYKQYDDNQRDIVMTLYFGNAHLAYRDDDGTLLYPNFRACATAHIRKSYSTVYEHLKAGILAGGIVNAPKTIFTVEDAIPTFMDYVGQMPKEQLFGLKELPDETARRAAIELAMGEVELNEKLTRPTSTALKTAVGVVKEIYATGGNASIGGESVPISPIKAAMHDSYVEAVKEIQENLANKRKWRWRNFPAKVAFFDSQRNRVEFELTPEQFKEFEKLAKEAHLLDAKSSISIQERVTDNSEKT